MVQPAKDRVGEEGGGGRGREMGKGQGKGKGDEHLPACPIVFSEE